MIEPRNFDIWKADALILAESNTDNIVTVRCCLLLRGQRAFHGAVKELYKRLNLTKICYIVDADIKGFFDYMKYDWIMRFLNLYIKDPNILWLVGKYLKARVMDGGRWLKMR